VQRTQLPAGSDFAYEVGVRKLDIQLRRIDALDSKAGNLLAADGLLAGILFGTSSLLVSAPRFVTVLLVASVFGSLLLALLAFASRHYEDAPSPVQAARFARSGETWLKWRFMKQILLAINVNDRKLRWKAGCLAGSLCALVAAVSLLGGYLTHIALVR
jgi:hypothetical protein